MFITSDYNGYNRAGEQSAGGLFLLVAGGATFMLDEESGKQVMVRLPLRACVRHVRMTQMGPWMMARVRVGPARVVLSGSYGGDGLPLDAEKVPYARMLPLPPELEREFWAGGGHNCAGSEAGNMRKWARANLRALRQAGSGRGRRE